MDALLFILLLISSSLGTVNILLMILAHRQGTDPGFRSLLTAFIPLTAVSFLETLAYFLENYLPPPLFPLLGMSLCWALLAIAFGWQYATIRHYALNRVKKENRRCLRLLYLLCTGLFLAIGGTYLFWPRFIPVLPTLLIILLFHAAIRAVLLRQPGGVLWESTRLGKLIAGISLIIYPAIALGESMGIKMPLVKHKASFWLQAHPLYASIINLAVLIFFLSRMKVTPEGKAALFPLARNCTEPLSRREKEVAALLIQGLRYEEMAETLFVSTATVKTHVHHIYQKLGISRREELYRLCMEENYDPEKELPHP